MIKLIACDMDGTLLDDDKRLPRDLGEAVDAFRGSQLMREILGEHMHSYIVQAKQAEWTEYCSTVSAWELDRYLAVL